MSKCIDTVADAWRSWPCPHPAKYGEYCGIHSPEKKAERAAKRGPTQWERDCAARKEYADALDGVLTAARELVGSTPMAETLRDALAHFDSLTTRGIR